MKKLMMIVLGCVIGLAAQAAQVTWSATAIAQSGTSTSYYGYLVDTATTTLTDGEAIAKALKAGTFDGTVLWSGAGSWNTSKSQAAITAAKQAIPESYAAGDTVSYAAIVFDADSASAAQNYLVTGSGDVKIATSGLLQIGNGSQAGKSWSSLGSTPPGPGPDPIPEPTSGLLLLVGGALLALRRKQK